MFENVRPAAAEQVTKADPVSEPGAAMRALSALGNAAFLGALGASAFFGYYTVRYDADTLRTVVHETHKEENQFVGSTVRITIYVLLCYRKLPFAAIKELVLGNGNAVAVFHC